MSSNCRGRGRLPIALVASIVAVAGCTSTPTASPGRITTRASADGVAFEQGGRPVLFYRSRAEAGREPWRVNYIHPLYSVAGAVVTEDAPSDHLHQRGIYWAWRRIFVDGVKVADGWVGEHLVTEVGVPTVRSWPDGSAQVGVRATWRAPVAGVEQPIIEETSTIRAYPVAGGRRKLELEVRLRALRDGVALAGTDDDKGYGGLSFRFAHGSDVQLEADGQPIRATLARLRAGNTIVFRWPTLPTPWPESIRISCRVGDAPWPHWVLRQEPSMQNCAYPGKIPVTVPANHPLTFRATLEIG
jgi:hypothetical protein